MSRRSKIDKTMRHLLGNMNEGWSDYVTDLASNIRAQTPYVTGRSRNAWKQVGKLKLGKNADKKMLQNLVEYTSILNKGRHMTSRGMRGSKQAPRGIVGPAMKKTNQEK